MFYRNQESGKKSGNPERNPEIRKEIWKSGKNSGNPERIPEIRKEFRKSGNPEKSLFSALMLEYYIKLKKLNLKNFNIDQL